MKQIVVITVILTVIAIAILGCLYIFEIMNPDAVFDSLVKVVAAILLLGGCTALIKVLTGGKD